MPGLFIVFGSVTLNTAAFIAQFSVLLGREFAS
jgi:hypothetical protein